MKAAKTMCPQEDFYTSLSQKGIDDNAYQHALNVFKAFSCPDMSFYLKIYNESDTLLLLECIQTFRMELWDVSKLDMTSFISAPSYAIQGALFMSNAKIDYIRCPKQLLFISRGLRGGFCCLTKKYVNFEHNNSYFVYDDCNSLYSFCLKEPTPIGAYRFLTNTEVANFDISQTGPNDPKGFILEVCIEYPSSLEVDHDLLPLLVTRERSDKDKLSAASLSQMFADNYNNVGEKLLATTDDKHKYIIHYEMLRYVLSKGLKIRKIHKILEFDQARIFDDFINGIVERRRQAHSHAKKTVLKLFLNACYGKLCENPLRYRSVTIVKQPRVFERYFRSSTYISHMILNESSLLVFSRPSKILFKSPIASSLTVLDRAKLTQCRYYYDVMLPSFGKGTKLIYTDTDSIICETPNGDLSLVREKMRDVFDFSNMPIDHKSFTNDTRNVPGLYKNENPYVDSNSRDSDDFIIEWFGLAPKLYCIVQRGGAIDSKAKGIPYSIRSRQLTREAYANALFNGIIKKTDYTRIGVSLDHNIKRQIGLIHDSKYLLSLNDTKRYWVSACNGFCSVNLGRKDKEEIERSHNCEFMQTGFKEAMYSRVAYLNDDQGRGGTLLTD